MPWGSFVRARKNPEAYRTRELADAFGVTPQAVTRWFRRGFLPGTRIGPRTIIFPRAAIHAMLRRGKHINL